MPARILLIDYNFDWVLRDGYLNPRTQAGFLTLKEVVSVCGELGADGLELMHPYWKDCPARQLQSWPPKPACRWSAISSSRT